MYVCMYVSKIHQVGVQNLLNIPEAAEMDSGGAEMDLEAAQMDPGGAEVPKLESKIHQVGSQNPRSWALKSTKLGSQIKKNQSWEVSGGVLGPSWPQDPPKTKIYIQNQFLGALLGTSFGGQNFPKINFLGFQEALIL